MSSALPRPITEVEVALIREAFGVAATSDARPEMLSSLSQLQVIHCCPCGCASVSFAISNEAEHSLMRVADALGTTPQGESVGFMVRATSSQVAHIEVYWHHSGAAPLPVLGSLKSYAAATA